VQRTGRRQRKGAFRGGVHEILLVQSISREKKIRSYFKKNLSIAVCCIEPRYCKKIKEKHDDLLMNASSHHDPNEKILSVCITLHYIIHSLFHE
jgi:hypothetical protein